MPDRACPGCRWRRPPDPVGHGGTSQNFFIFTEELNNVNPYHPAGTVTGHGRRVLLARFFTIPGAIPLTIPYVRYRNLQVNVRRHGTFPAPAAPGSTAGMDRAGCPAEPFRPRLSAMG